jgi:RimJ/RimL family protein N-acetyltransferase
VIPILTSRRLRLRPWIVEDDAAAFEVYSHTEVASWLSPAMDAVRDRHEMRLVLQHWVAENHRSPNPTGRWAIELTEQNRVIGGMTLLYLPPGRTDLEIGWQLAPAYWGHGYASEAGHALAHWAFESPGVDEVFAVVRPANARGAATAQRIGMEWVGETDKYYDLQLQVYRVRPADLDRPLADQQYGADQHQPPFR